ncbi:hypothetical protein ACHAWX_002544 [Stephanocyclus meneghinianus]
MASQCDQNQELLSSIAKSNATVTTSLHRAIRQHTKNKDYDARTDGLDYLQVKNGIMISYLVDLTVLLRCRLRDHRRNASGTRDEADNDMDRRNDEASQQCVQRLLEMKAAMEKMRPLEKRMSYQIDKLLALSTLGARTFAAVGREQEEKEDNDDDDEVPGHVNEQFDESDPLSFKPDLQGMMNMFEDTENNVPAGGSEDDSEDKSNDDDEFNSSKPDVMLEKDDNQPGVYQPPRLQAMPFEMNEHKHEKEERLRKKQRDRMQRSELAEVVRAQFTDAPEEEDIRGGALLGQQREISKRLAQREADVAEFEEAHMIRLTMGKKEKKERKRIMREEMSNLGAIADLGNVVAGVDDAFGDGSRSGRSRGGSKGGNAAFVTKGMRKRKVEVLDHEMGAQGQRGGGRSKGTSNSFQKALYGGRKSIGKSKKKK